MDVQSFLENPWTSGIGGGIISGFIVFYVTRWLLQRKDKRNYINSVHSANKQVIDFLKAYVVDKGLPDYQIVNAIISATAREFSVKKEELYDVVVVCEELIKEIIGNVYVSGDQKQKYLEDLSLYMEKVKKARCSIKSLDLNDLEDLLDESFHLNVSLMLGGVSALFGFIIPFLPRLFRFFKESYILTITVIMICLVLVIFYLIFLNKGKKQHK